MGKFLTQIPQGASLDVEELDCRRSPEADVTGSEGESLDVEETLSD